MLHEYRPVRSENVVVENIRPRFVEHDASLDWGNLFKPSKVCFQCSNRLEVNGSPWPMKTQI